MGTPDRRIYSISDLHLGGVYGAPGERGFRLCTQVPALVTFLDQLTAKPDDKPPIELVINGDMVDFLAEREDGGRPWVPFTTDQATAAKKLSDIMGRDQAFTDALKRYLDAGHRLVILLGNHDIELTLPAVRERLHELLGIRGSHDFTFIHDGEAYLAGDVLIEHGNRYDKFNVVNQDALRHFRSLLSRRQPVPPEYVFDPPPGSRMVSTVINPIKEKYRFVDLLKPETGAVIPLLLALEPDFKSQLTHAVRLSLAARENHLAGPAMPGMSGNISATGAMGVTGGSNIAAMGGPVTGAIPEPGDPLGDELRKRMGEDADGFLATIHDTAPGAGRNISALDDIGHAVGMLELLLSRDSTKIEKRMRALLKSLRALNQDQSFSRDVETDGDTWKSAQELASNGIRHVVFGHTHLPKRIRLRDGGYYLNSGTWADVLAFPKEILQGADDQVMPKLQEVVQCLHSGDFSRWTTFHPTYVRIDLDDQGTATAAELCDYSEGTTV